MKILFVFGLLLATLTASVGAFAWDGDVLWYAPAHGKKATPYNVMPGGGGILGTGGATDYTITCAHCHIKGADNYGSISVAFNPAFGSTYTPGKKYDVTISLRGEHLGLSGCGQYTNGNVNEFAATFEDQSGKIAGALQATYGSTASCPTTPPPTGFTGSTFMYGDCHAVIASAVKDRTSWTFSWTAPPAGAGQVTLYYGAVDGDCMMDSLKDDVKVGSFVMGEGMAALEPRRGPSGGPTSGNANALALLGALPIVALAWGARRRRR